MVYAKILIIQCIILQKMIMIGMKSSYKSIANCNEKPYKTFSYSYMHYSNYNSYLTMMMSCTYVYISLQAIDI